MHFPKKIIFLLLSIICFSCKTKLEKQGWRRTAIVSQVDSSTIKKDKELVVQKMYYKSSPFYRFYISEKDSIGKIICREFASGAFFNSDIAYYKLESDSSFLVKLFRQGNLQTSLKLGFSSTGSLDVLYMTDRSQPENESFHGTAIVSRPDTSGIKNDKELVVERLQLNGLYYYNLAFVEKDPAGKVINKPAFVFEKSFKSDMAYYKWESDSLCIIRLMSHGNIQASLKYIEYSDSSSSYEFVNDLKQSKTKRSNNNLFTLTSSEPRKLPIVSSSIR